MSVFINLILDLTTSSLLLRVLVWPSRSWFKSHSFESWPGLGTQILGLDLGPRILGSSLVSLALDPQIFGSSLASLGLGPQILSLSLVHPSLGPKFLGLSLWASVSWFEPCWSGSWSLRVFFSVWVLTLQVSV